MMLHDQELSRMVLPTLEWQERTRSHTITITLKASTLRLVRKGRIRPLRTRTQITMDKNTTTMSQQTHLCPLDCKRL